MGMGNVFGLLERLGMGFPKGKLSNEDGGMNAKVKFEESTNFILKSSTGEEIKGK